MEILFDTEYAKMQVISVIKNETIKLEELEKKFLGRINELKIAQANYDLFYETNKIKIDIITAELESLRKKDIKLVQSQIGELQRDPIYSQYILLKKKTKMLSIDDKDIQKNFINAIIKKQEKILEMIQTNPLEIINIDITSVRTNMYNYIKHLLEHMTSYDLFIIFNILRDDILKIKNIEYNIIGNFKSKEDRLIVYVYSIQLNDETKIDINKAFFKSSGTSRSLGCTHCWIPTSYYRKFDSRISKDEDDYVTDINFVSIPMYEPKTILTQKNEIIIRNFSEFKTTANNLLNYGRFINKNNALASIILYWLDKDLLSGFSTRVSSVRELTIDYLNTIEEANPEFKKLLDQANNIVHEFNPINICKYYDTNISIPTFLKENSILSNSSNIISSTLNIYSFDYKSFKLNTIYHYMIILEILVNMYKKLSDTTALAGGRYGKYYSKYLKYKIKYLTLKN